MLRVGAIFLSKISPTQLDCVPSICARIVGADAHRGPPCDREVALTNRGETLIAQFHRARAGWVPAHTEIACSKFSATNSHCRVVISGYIGSDRIRDAALSVIGKSLLR